MWYAYPQHSTGRGNFSLVNNHYEMASRGALASPLSMTAGLSQHNPHTHTHTCSVFLQFPLFFSLLLFLLKILTRHLRLPVGVPLCASPSPTLVRRGLVRPRLQRRHTPVLVFYHSKQMEKEREVDRVMGWCESLATGT